MSDSHEHSVGLPDIHDEAGDTPMWVPLLGLVLLVLATLYLVISAAMEDIEGETDQAVPAAAAAPSMAAE